LTFIGSKSVNEGGNLSFALSASDPDADGLTYSATSLPNGASFNTATRTFSWTPDNTQAGNYNLTFSVSDGNLSDSEAIAITVGNVNRPPVLTSIGSKSVNEGGNLSFALSASDPDGDSLAYSVTSLPSGASFNSATRTFNWTLGTTQAGNYGLTFSVSDGSLSDTETMTITVGNVNQPPVLTSIGNKNVNEGANLNLTLSANDPDGDSLTYSASGLPSGASFNPATQTFDWSPNSDQVDTFNLTFSVSDGSLSDSETVTISVGLTVPEGLSLLPSENGLPGVDRVDGGDDSNNHVNGMPKSDLSYVFRIVVRDPSGGDLPNVFLNLNGYAYEMTRETGAVETGATYAFTTRLGPAASQHFYFEIRDTAGNVLSQFPTELDLAGPQVEFLNGKNIVGAVGDINSQILTSLNAIGTSQSFRWIPSEKQNGSYARVDASGPVILGEGYIIKRSTDSTLPSLEQFGDNPALTYEIPVKTGWNLIANPYGGNVQLTDILVRAGNGSSVSWAEAVSQRMVIDGIYYYSGKDWGNSNIFESSGEGQAILIPRIGYWIYVNSVDEPMSLIIPKPQQ